MKKERRSIPIRPVVQIYEELEVEKDRWYKEAVKTDPELRAGWYGFFMMLFRFWMDRKPVSIGERSTMEDVFDAKYGTIEIRRGKNERY